ncbi:MAG: glycosyltransferase, partial [Mycoplasma sp.]
LSKEEIQNNLAKWKRDNLNREDFIYIGRINKKQKAILKIKDIFTKSKLNIDFYGSGQKELMVNNDYCNFKGPIKSEDIDNEIIKYKYAVLLSKYEGFSYFLVEALSRGVPIITTNCSANSKTLSENKGFLVNYKNASERIKFANNLPEYEYNKLVEECFKFSVKNLSLEVFEEKWIKFIKSIN